MQTWRWRELLQMLGVNSSSSHSHVGSQALREVRHRLIDVLLWQDDFNSSVALVFGWSLWYGMAPQT